MPYSANHLVELAFVLLLDEVAIVKPIFLICLCLTSLGSVASNGFDNRNFAIDTYFPATNKIQLAEGVREIIGIETGRVLGWNLGIWL